MAGWAHRRGAGSPTVLGISLALGAALWGQPSIGSAEETMEPGAGARSEGTAKLGTRPAARETGALKGAKVTVPKVDPSADAVAPLLADLRRGAAGAGEDAAVDAVKKLGALGTPRAMDALLGELSTGLSPKVATAALDVLVAHKPTAEDPSPLAVYSLYAHHRNAELRRRAYSGLAALPDAPAGSPAPAAGQAAAPTTSPAVPMLIAALSDSSAEVRQVAAQALGTRHEKSAEPALIKLLLRKDPAAPLALGQIGGADTARALAEMIGNVPDRMILETLGELLKRPDFGPEQVRTGVVKTIGKMPGAQTLDILTDYVKMTAPDKNAKDKAPPRPSRVEALKIIEQRTAK